jgi:hypothetical protein
VVLGEIEKASQRISTPRRPRLEQFKWELVQTSSGWLTPLILATEEAEIRRIRVLSQPKQIVRKTLPGKNPT